MAERRMFAKTIIDSDAFLDMPLSSQALYFHLSMRADDDGFINNPKKIQRMIGASEDDLKLLVAKNFIIPFESGIVVIKHWKIHNYIQSDRYKPTVYQEEKAALEMKKNRAYTICDDFVSELDTGKDTECIHDVSKMETQDRLGKDRLGKNRLDKSNKRAPDYERILSDIKDPSLKSLYLDYIEMRKFIKSPMTERALSMLISKVNQLEPNNVDRQKEMLKTAIMNNWKSVYPLKDKQTQSSRNASYCESEPDPEMDEFIRSIGGSGNG